MNHSHLKPFFLFITDAAFKLQHFTPLSDICPHPQDSEGHDAGVYTECFVCMLINRRPCTSSGSNKTLDNIVGNLIIFGVAITAHTELNYFSLDMMCTSKFTHFALASKSHLDLNHT